MACEKSGKTTEPSQISVTSIQKSGKIKVCYVPYSSTVIKDPNSQMLSGHFIDAMNFIAETLQVKVEYVETDFQSFIAYLQSGKCDLSIAATYSTILRAAAVSFSNPIIYLGNGAIVKYGDSRFSKPEDFNQDGLIIAVSQGEASHNYAKQHFPKAKLLVIASSDLSLPLLEVITGRADVGLADSWSTEKFAKTNSGKVTDLFAGRPYDVTPVGWAVRTKDQELLNFINTSINYLESTGRMSEWEKKYKARWMKIDTKYKHHDLD